jgi:chromosomal replication initiator protein
MVDRPRNAIPLLEGSGMSADILNAIADEVAGHFAVSVSNLRSSRRTRQILPARHAAVYLASELSGLSPVRVGAWFGHRDASLVLLYRRAVMRRMAQDQTFAASIATLEKSLSRF